MFGNENTNTIQSGRQGKQLHQKDSHANEFYTEGDISADSKVENGSVGQTKQQMERIQKEAVTSKVGTTRQERMKKERNKIKAGDCTLWKDTHSIPEQATKKER